MVDSPACFFPNPANRTEAIFLMPVRLFQSSRTRLLTLTAAVLAFLAPSSKAADIDFNRDIQPILSDNCYFCHGPDSQTREAGLRLDQEKAAKEDRDGVIAVAPGDPEHSELIYRVFTTDEKDVMPPPDSERSLSPKERELLKEWIAQGAEWEQHWSFVPPTRPDLPEVKQEDWPRNGIDWFVLHRLEQEGLKPSPEASKETLIRRVTQDLTGLPPTYEEVKAFLEDESDTAYEKAVDRLLRSDRYGEAMALQWLDAARYADTDGYQNDGPREMWRWRDWVIDAYNSGKTFDRFTIEQLAGDLLPNATLDQKIATGFNRNNRYNSEAGLVLEEFLLENAVDRVDTTSTVWMGLTMGCARCHDHKYDPISQKEYYELISIFGNITECGRAIKFGNSEPYIKAPAADQQAALQKVQRREADARKALEAREGEVAEAEAKWAPNFDGKAPPVGVVSQGLTAHFTFDGDTSGVTKEKGKPVFREGLPGRGNAATVGGGGVFALGEVGDFSCQKRFSLSFWLKPEELKEGVVLSRQGGDTRRPGLAVELRDGHLQFFIISRWVAGVGAVETAKPLRQDEWVHVTLTNDGSQTVSGMKIYLDGQPAAATALYNTNSNAMAEPKNTPLRLGGGVYGANFKGQVDELRIYGRTLWADEIALLAEPVPVVRIAALSPDKRTKTQAAVLRAYFLEQAAPKPLSQLAQSHFEARVATLSYWDKLPTTMVMEEKPEAPFSHVRNRGVYNDLGEKVTPAVPEIFPAMGPGLPRNRLGFAQWLVSGEHPLTARVTVNRYWLQYFGTGLVKTAEDFGLQGELPSHPELLDWLATEFVRAGWDVKAMQRLIVTSATYQQASKITPELQEKDPQNRLLARGPRQRLSAHALRDQALALSGLMAGDIGGPSVSPYQPDRLWEEMSNASYKQSKGKDLYRRSLYTIWKRTVAPPSMIVMDAADRESCWIRAKRTNTPLQALTLLNETAFVEAARHLAARMMTEGGEDPVTYGFHLVTARQPGERELTLLRQAYQEYLAEYRQDPKAAKELLSIGESPQAKDLDPVEQAAHTALANVLLNLDEAITKE